MIKVLGERVGYWGHIGWWGLWAKGFECWGRGEISLYCGSCRCRQIEGVQLKKFYMYRSKLSSCIEYTTRSRRGGGGGGEGHTNGLKDL